MATKRFYAFRVKNVASGCNNLPRAKIAVRRWGTRPPHPHSLRSAAGFRHLLDWALDRHGDVATTGIRVLLPARRYAIAGTSYNPVSACLCLSQVGVLSKRLNESGWFWHESFLRPMCCKEIQVTLNVRVLPSGTLLQALGLENFATAYRSSKRAIGLSSRMVDAESVINWTIVGQLTAKFYYTGPTRPDPGLRQSPRTLSETRVWSGQVGPV